MSNQLALFDPNAPHMTPAERRALMTRVPRKGLYAAQPGGGPEGETCGSCAHLRRKQMAKTYLKCALTAKAWTGGAGTDVKARAPACSKWQKKDT